MPEIRYAGFQGSVYLNGNTSPGNLVTWIFNWSLEIMQEVAESAVKGEVHDQQTLGGVSTRVNAERFSADHTTGGDSFSGSVPVTSLVSSNAPTPTLGSPAGSAVLGQTVEYYLYGIDIGKVGGVPAAGAYIHGFGVLTRSSANNPRAGATEQFEIVGTNMPTIVVTV